MTILLTILIALIAVELFGIVLLLLIIAGYLYPLAKLPKIG